MQLAFCRLAERYGIDSLLTAFGSYMPDPIVNIAALSANTGSIRFLLAHRPGVMLPAMFVQQVNTLSTVSGGRLSLNIVIGHSQQEQRSYGDLLDYRERYRRADDFLAVCHSFWRRAGDVNFSSDYYHIENGSLETPFVSPDRMAPEIYCGGGSELSRELAARHADCWLRLGTTPEAMKPEVDAMRARGVEVGVRLSLIVRATREEAVHAAYSLVAEHGNKSWVTSYFASGSDSESVKAGLARREIDAEHWPRRWLWTGAVSSFGPSAICIVGTPEEIASAIGEYRRIGVSQFILSGWPNSQALQLFGEHVLPLVRAGERPGEQEVGGPAVSESDSDRSNGPTGRYPA